MAKNLYNLTAVTTVNDSDLLHVNQGSVSSDKKVTKQNLLKEVNSSITSLNNSLTNSFTWKSSTEEASVATGTSWVKALQFSVTTSQFIRAFLRYSATPPSEIMITSGTTLGAVPVLAHASAPSSGATAHPLYTPSVLLSPGTYYLYAKSTASGTNGVGIQRTNV